jgi:hypothetical protein
MRMDYSPQSRVHSKDKKKIGEQKIKNDLSFLLAFSVLLRTVFFDLSVDHGR